MKIEVNNKELFEAVSIVSKAVSSKSAIPVLEGILIKTNDDSISLIGFDLEMGIKTEIEAVIKEKGEIVVNSKLFSDIIRSMPGETVNIEIDNNKMVKVTSLNSEFSIVGLDAAEYPEMPSLKEEENLKISEPLLKRMIRQTSFAVSVSDDKPIFKGILFELSEDNIKLVAVDGYRLAIKQEKINNNKIFKFVVPGKVLSEIVRLLGDDENNTAEVIVGNRHVSFKIGKYYIISRLLEGEFINYEMAIPKTSSTKVIADTSMFIDSVDRVSLLINDRTASPISCIFENNTVKAFCSTTMGRANDEFEAKTEGERIEISFNNRFLIDALRASENATVKLEMNTSRSPIVIKPCTGDDFLYLILPIMMRNDG